MSGWSTATIQTSEHSKLHSALEDELADESLNIREGRQGLVCNVWGYSTAGVLKDAIENHINLVDGYVVIIEANDTSDSGNGTVYSVRESGLKKEEGYTGHEGAEAMDVRGQIGTDYNILPAVR